jgi:hypothetical protein
VLLQWAPVYCAGRERFVDDSLGFFEDVIERVPSPEALAINLIDVFGP